MKAFGGLGTWLSGFFFEWPPARLVVVVVVEEGGWESGGKRGGGRSAEGGEDGEGGPLLKVTGVTLGAKEMCACDGSRDGMTPTVAFVNGFQLEIRALIMNAPSTSPCLPFGVLSAGIVRQRLERLSPQGVALCGANDLFREIEQERKRPEWLTTFNLIYNKHY
jgi:hypothetical protein